MDRHHVGRLHRVQDADAVGDRLHLRVHDRRRDRRGAGKSGSRPVLPGRVLRGRAHPIRLVARRRFLDLRRLVLLVSQDHRVHVFGGSGKAPFLADLCRGQSRILSDALPGMAGMPRRIADYPDAFAGMNEISSIGAYISAVGLIVFFVGLAYALIRKVRAGDNPWGAGATTLEWTLSSPPPFHAYDVLPRVY